MNRKALTLAIVTAGTLLAGCAVEESANPGGGSVDVPAASAAASQAPPAAASPKAPAAPQAPAGGLADGSFTSTAPAFKDDGLGSFGGTARVTNTSGSEKTGTFTYTIFKGSEQVGTAVGVANTVGAGVTSTVQLISQDKFAAGPYRVEFQVDAEF